MARLFDSCCSVASSVIESLCMSRLSRAVGVEGSSALSIVYPSHMSAR
jgi:hypothetical protein